MCKEGGIRLNRIIKFVTITFFLIAIFPIHTFAESENKTVFSDIPSSWAKDYIDYLAKKQIISGVTEHTFEPGRNITRAELATLLVKAAGLESKTVTDQTYFLDVKESNWYAADVRSIASTGIISGYEDGTFRPNHAITREEAAIMLKKALDYNRVAIELTDAQQTHVLTNFKDEVELSFGKKEVAEIINSGIMKGISEDYFAPQASLTREQVSIILVRYLSLFK